MKIIKKIRSLFKGYLFRPYLAFKGLVGALFLSKYQLVLQLRQKQSHHLNIDSIKCSTEKKKIQFGGGCVIFTFFEISTEYLFLHVKHIFFPFQVRYTGFRDRPQEERQVRFQNGCREGHTEIVSIYLPQLFTDKKIQTFTYTY